MPSLFSFENLHRQYMRCRRHKRGTRNALRFDARLEENLVQLHEELESRTYHPSRSVCFLLKQPKFREIFAADFRDRVVHHVLVDALERDWERRFIHDSYACRKGKGTHRAVARVQTFMRRVTHNGTRPGYALQLDIQGFFFNIDKEVLFQILDKHLQNDALRWLARTMIFHDCTHHVIFKGNRGLWRQIPSHKTLFGTGNVRGLPIGNLSSQFFSNVYLNELDQFAKHHLKVRHYLRYSDDFVLVHEDPAQLLTWREALAAFLEERLHLCLTKPLVRPRLISNGLDFLGYIVRPDYLLVRRRVVNKIKVRLTGYQGQLVRLDAGAVVFTHDAAALASLRASWAASLAHMQRANSYRLRQALRDRHGWLRHFFRLDEGLLTPWIQPLTRVGTLRQQYQMVTQIYPDALVWCQVGCFYECYDAGAEWVRQHLGLAFTPPRCGFARQCGVPGSLFPQLIRRLMPLGRPVCVVREIAGRVGPVRPRGVAEYWQPVPGTLFLSCEYGPHFLVQKGRVLNREKERLVPNSVPGSCA